MSASVLLSLCQVCRQCREIATGRGSRFWLCELSQRDAAYPKYPPQPVLRCAGFVPREGGDESRDN